VPSHPGSGGGYLLERLGELDVDTVDQPGVGDDLDLLSSADSSSSRTWPPRPARVTKSTELMWASPAMIRPLRPSASPSYTSVGVA
jgi:hypothetical protein